MRKVIDDTGHAAAIIRKALKTELHLRLIEETHDMLAAGAKIEDVVWFITPSVAIADRRQEALAHLEEAWPEMAELVRELPKRVPGRMYVLYLGPEGAICQQWESLLTVPAAQL